MKKLNQMELHKIQQKLNTEFTLGTPNESQVNKSIIKIVMRAIDLYNQSLSDLEKQ